MAHSSYAGNSYLTYTEGSFVKTFVFITNSQQTLDRIGVTKPDVYLQAGILNPTSKYYNDQYLIWDFLKNISLRKTVKEVLFEKFMIKTVRQLDVDIQHFFDETSESYNDIFIKGRSTLYNGLSTATQTINYKSLSLRINKFPVLLALQTDFDLKITNFDIAIKASTDSKTDMDQQSILLEAARINWCDEAYGVTGQLMTIYKKTPGKIDDIFDISIFSTRQSHIDPDSGAEVVALPVGGKVVWNGIFDPSKYYQIHYLGFESLNIGSAPSADTHPLTNPCTMKEDETRIFAGGELGPLTNRYLIFISNDTVLPGELKIKEVDDN